MQARGGREKRRKNTVSACLCGVHRQYYGFISHLEPQRLVQTSPTGFGVYKRRAKPPAGSHGGSVLPPSQEKYPQHLTPSFPPAPSREYMHKCHWHPHMSRVFKQGSYSLIGAPSSFKPGLHLWRK